MRHYIHVLFNQDLQSYYRVTILALIFKPDVLGTTMRGVALNDRLKTDPCKVSSHLFTSRFYTYKLKLT